MTAMSDEGPDVGASVPPPGFGLAQEAETVPEAEPANARRGFLERVGGAARSGVSGAHEEVRNSGRLLQDYAGRGDGSAVHSGLLQLRTLDKRLTFYENRVEITNLLGTGREVLPYSQVRGVAFKKHSTLKKMKSMGLNPSSHAKVLEITTGPGETIQHEFLREPLERVEQAYELINSRIGVQAVSVTVEAPVGAPASSAADELLKLADLKDKGILTQEEFDAKKKQLLGL